MSQLSPQQYVVTSNADAGAGSLRAALASAQTGDSIDFKLAPGSSSIVLTSGSLVVSNGVAIDGAGAVTVDGNGSFTDFVVDPGAGVAASIHGLGIVGGHGVGAAGADGTSQAALQYVQAGDGGNAAGGIYVASGSLDLQGDSFSNDVAVGGKGGQAAYLPDFGIYKGTGGTGGNAAGAVYVDASATVTSSGLSFGDGNMGTGGPGGIGYYDGGDPGPAAIAQNGPAPSGQGYAISNDSAVACFCTGTLIATRGGDVPVEEVRVGMEVLTASGERRAVRWVGHRSHSARRLRNDPSLMPVRFPAGSLGVGLPRRDLHVSPRHGMALGGVLIPAECLDGVGGISRSAPEGSRGVVYWHLELDRHCLVVSEGVASESFVDDGSRSLFDHSEGRGVSRSVRGREPERCLPLLESGPRVAAARRAIGDHAAWVANATGTPHVAFAQPAVDLGAFEGRLDAVSDVAVSGWARSARSPDSPVLVEVVADGAVVARGLTGAFRPDLLAAGYGHGRLGFSIPTGADLRSAARVAVRRVCDGAVLASFHDDAAPVATSPAKLSVVRSGDGAIAA